MFRCFWTMWNFELVANPWRCWSWMAFSSQSLPVASQFDYPSGCLRSISSLTSAMTIHPLAVSMMLNNHYLFHSRQLNQFYVERIYYTRRSQKIREKLIIENPGAHGLFKEFSLLQRYCNFCAIVSESLAQLYGKRCEFFTTWRLVASSFCPRTVGWIFLQKASWFLCQ